MSNESRPVETLCHARDGSARAVRRAAHTSNGLMAFVSIEKADARISEKSGATPFIRTLRQSFGVRHCDVFSPEVYDPADVEDEVAFVRRFHPGLRSIAGHVLVPSGFPDSSVHFYTFLREPLSRCLAHYQSDPRKAATPFADWIAQPRFRDFQVTKIAGSANLEGARAMLRERFFFVGLVEDFDRSYHALAALAPYPMNLDSAPRNFRSHYEQKYDILGNKVQRRLLEEANQLDSALYSWVRDELYPEFLNRAAEAPPRAAPRWKGLRAAANMAWRNLVYRPAWRALGRRP
jgi:hypothetical protein